MLMFTACVQAHEVVDDTDVQDDDSWLSDDDS